MKLIPDLAPPQLEQVLAVARQFEDVSDKVKIMGAIARRQSEPLKSALVKEALNSIRDSQGPGSLFLDPLVRTLANTQALKREDKKLQRSSRETDLAMLGADLIRTHAMGEPEAVGALRITENGKHAENALRKLADGNRIDRDVDNTLAAWGCDADAASFIPSADEFPESVLPSLVKKAGLLHYEWARAAVLESISHRLSQPLLEEALSKSKTITEPRMRAKTLAVLGLRLDDPEKQALIAREASEVAATLTDQEKLRVAAAEVARVLPQSIRRRVLQTMGIPRKRSARRKQGPKTEFPFPAIPDESAPAIISMLFGTDLSAETKVRTLEHLAPKFAPESMERVLAAINTLQDGDNWDSRQSLLKAQALRALIPYLPLELIPQAIECALTLYGFLMNGILRMLLLRITDIKSRQATLTTILAATLATQANHRIAPVLDEVSPFLSTPLAEIIFERLTKIPTLRSWDDRAKALATLIPMLGPSSRQAALQQALSALRNDEDKDEEEDVLVSLAPYLRAELHTEALKIARANFYLPSRIKALAALSQTPPQSVRDDILEEALKDAVRIERSEEFEDDRARQDALNSLIPLVSKLPRSRQYELWSHTLWELSSRAREDLLDDLPTLAPVLHDLGGDREIEQVVQLLLQARHWWSHKQEAEHSKPES
jgi:hypothetical protein